MERSRDFIIIFGCLGVLLFLAGCNAGADGLPEGEFPCESDGDCIEGYECIDGICKVPTPRSTPPCDPSADPEGDIDLDNDGYGDGPDRTNCPRDNYQNDCDDTRSDIYPGAPELCDDQDNDCDGEIDEFECETSLDCGDEPSSLRSFLSYACEDNTCVMRPARQLASPECEQIVVTCSAADGGFSYEFDGQSYDADQVPEECR